MFSWLYGGRQRRETKFETDALAELREVLPNAEIIAIKTDVTDGSCITVEVEWTDYNCYILVRDENSQGPRLVHKRNHWPLTWLTRSRSYNVRTNGTLQTVTAPELPSRIAEWYLRLTIPGFQRMATVPDQVI